jgi:hypothetical protein
MVKINLIIILLCFFGAITFAYQPLSPELIALLQYYYPSLSSSNLVTSLMISNNSILLEDLNPEVTNYFDNRFFSLAPTTELVTITFPEGTVLQIGEQ